MKNLDISSKEELVSLKESLSKILDDKIANATLNERINSVSQMPFGHVKTLFEGVVDKLYDNSKNNIIGAYVKELTENKSLGKLYTVYESLNKPLHTKVPSLYLNEMLNLAKSIDNKTLSEGVNNLRNLTQMALLESNISFEDFDNILNNSNKELNESINYLINTKKNVNNLNEYVNHFDTVETYINNNMFNESENSNGLVTFESLNNIFDNDLALWENKAIKDYMLNELRNGDKSELFEQYKNDCLSTIEEAMDTDDINLISRLSTMKEQIKTKEYKSETIMEDILKFSELKELLN